MTSLGVSSLEGGAGVTASKILTIVSMCIPMCDVICNDVREVSTDRSRRNYVHYGKQNTLTLN